MDLLTDLRSRLPFRSSRPVEEGNRLGVVGELLLGSGEFLVARIDRGGLVTAANAALCRRRGAESGELLGTGLQYLVNAGERDAFATLVRGVFMGSEGGSVVARLLTTNGEPMPAVRWSLVPLPGAAGGVDSALCIGTDLSPFFGVSEPAPPRVVGAAELEELEELEELREEVQGLRAAKCRLEKEVRRLEATPTAPPAAVPAALVGDEEDPPTLAELERRHIFHTLQATQGRVSGRKGAAVLLGLHPNTLRSRMEKLGIGKQRSF